MIWIRPPDGQESDSPTYGQIMGSPTYGQGEEMKELRFHIQLMAEDGAAPAESDQALNSEEAVQEPQKPEDLEAEFDALVKGDGKFREIYGKRVQKASHERNKGLRATVERFNSFSPAMEVLAARYGMSVDDPKLAETIASDKSLLENLAMENGNSTEVQMELTRARAAQQRAEGLVQQIMADREMQGWMQQAEALAEEHPEFDLETEMKNPVFQNMLRNGVTMDAAYMAIHWHDVKAKVVADAERKATDAVAAGRKRPRENGIGSQAGAAMQADPAKMSSAEFQDYMRRVERGERISFSTK